MRIWIDLANSPHVPFFRAIVPELEARGHQVEITARDFAETLQLAKAANLGAKHIGAHGGRAISAKAGNLQGRARKLWSWARGHGFDIAVSHNSYSQIVAAKILRVKSITLMDYEHQPANHLAFRLASRVIVPQHFPAASLKRFGAHRHKVRRYNGTKEDVYLSDFKADPEFSLRLIELGINGKDVLVVVRPAANEALYHRFENHLFDELLEWLLTHPQLKVVLLPRNTSQLNAYSTRTNLIIPSTPLDGANLIAASDLVISAGGTMNREAAALGVPAATIYAGRWAAVDEELCRTGRLKRLGAPADFALLPLTKKAAVKTRGLGNVRQQVTELILERFES